MFVLSFSEASFQWCIVVVMKQKRKVHNVQELTFFCVKILQKNSTLFIVMSL